jgi:hypothetical protein
MHSSKYNDLIRSLPGSSWLVLLTLAVVPKRSLPRLQSINISKFLSNANTKVNVTCITIFWPVQISNQELWARAKQRPIELEIRQRKWGWLGHTLRRPPGDIAKAALEWKPREPDPEANPEQHGAEQILEEIRHQGKTWKEVKVLAKNRVRWRNFVRNYGKLYIYL